LDCRKSTAEWPELSPMPPIADISLTQLALIAGLAAFSAIAGGVAGYGTGALMPLLLVPIVGAAPVVPIIAISALFTNSARTLAFRNKLEPRRAMIALVAALPTCVLGAWLYTLLSGRGAAVVIGTTLIATVPLRRVLKKRGHRLGEGGFAAAAAGWGILVGATTGAGVILLSLLMAAGLEGPAVIATDALVSIAMGVIKFSVFALAGAITPTVLLVGLVIGCIGFPSTFVARLIVERLPVHVHTAMLDAVALIGGGAMILGALR
jgi:uncharacterized membrane protein YfcA